MATVHYYQEIIKKYFKEFFEKGEVYLFGSKVDDNKKGGDIDLYFVLEEHFNLFEKKLKFLARVKRGSGVQKIDIVFNTDSSRLIEKEAIQFLRLENTFEALQTNYNFPITIDDFKLILFSTEYLAYSDQIIYRFSKLQDCMGAKLFNSVLLYEGENVNKAFSNLIKK